MRTYRTLGFALGFSALLAGCGSDGSHDGAEPTDDTNEPACRSSTLGRVSTPSPLVSVGKRIAGSADATALEAAVDGRYHGSTASVPAPTEDEPSFMAVEIGAGPERVLLVWTDPGWGAYNVLTGGPTSYRVETSGDSSDGSDGTWETVVTVETNVVRSRGHTFPFAGKSWVRLVMTGVSEGTERVTIDEIAVHDVSSAGDERPSDTWFFMGDSITQGGLQREFGASSVDRKVNQALPDFYPVVINGGIGGELTSQGNGHLAAWLEANPDFEHVGILYGTNDSWGNKTPEATGFRAELEELVQRLLDADRVPFVGTIPFASTAHDTLPEWNAVIESVVADKGLPCGPDFYAWFRDHPEDLSSDGVHPNTAGYRSMNQLWAETMQAFYEPVP
jgi:lysophospholipase L1-like esterase